MSRLLGRAMGSTGSKTTNVGTLLLVASAFDLLWRSDQPWRDTRRNLLTDAR